ncbi:MAG TPA: hypothetical protein VM052_01100 [Candidatus Limnocylindrales bacterium]|nr:hypothetical protein [Candidatus Limnocylindrales bacterium]
MKTLARLLLVSCSTACLDEVPDEMPPAPVARVIVAWDPRDCGEPHRVAVELEDHDGNPASTSTVCAIGSITLDVRHFGVYIGRIYAWSEGAIRGEVRMHLAVDEPISRWFIETPR